MKKYIFLFMLLVCSIALAEGVGRTIEQDMGLPDKVEIPAKATQKVIPHMAICWTQVDDRARQVVVFEGPSSDGIYVVGLRQQPGTHYFRKANQLLFESSKLMEDKHGEQDLGRLRNAIQAIQYPTGIQNESIWNLVLDTAERRGRDARMLRNPSK